MRVDLHPEARVEFRSATLWYEERSDRLGNEFVAAVAATLQRIGEAPETFPRWPGTRSGNPAVRKAIVERFPYLIAFEQHLDNLLVLGVAHQKRRPLYWLTRASRSPG